MPSKYKQIGFIVEGQTEVAFLSHFLLPKLFKNYSIDCYPSISSNYNPDIYNFSNDDAVLNFVIRDVGGDKAVITKANNNVKSMLKNKSYLAIYGLRDLYSSEYEVQFKKQFPGKTIVVDSKVALTTKKRIRESIKVKGFKLFFAEMELETWLLAFYEVFSKINSSCGIKYINRVLRVKIDEINLQSKFLRPAKELGRLKLSYKKGYPERITNHVNKSSLTNVIKSGVVSSFTDFYQDLSQYS